MRKSPGIDPGAAGVAGVVGGALLGAGLMASRHLGKEKKSEPVKKPEEEE
jgi:hypothetical protein